MNKSVIIWEIKNHPKEGEKTFRLAKRLELSESDLERIIIEHYIKENENDIDLAKYRFEAEFDNI
jgi:hypothetical protein